MNTAFTETVRMAALQEENRLLRAELDEVSDERDELHAQIAALKARMREIAYAVPGPQHVAPRPITPPVDRFTQMQVARALAMASGRVVRA